MKGFSYNRSRWILLVLVVAALVAPPAQATTGGRGVPRSTAPGVRSDDRLGPKYATVPAGRPAPAITIVRPAGFDTGDAVIGAGVAAALTALLAALFVVSGRFKGRSRRMSTGPLLAIAVVVPTAAALAAGAVALASGGGAPRTQPVAATYSLRPVDVTQRTCTGADGTYLEVRGVFEGTAKSSDPRFNGRVQVVVEPATLNLATGYGTVHAHATYWDAAGRKTTTGRVHEVLAQGHGTGQFVGQVVPADGLPGGELIGNFKTTIDAQLNLNGEFGSAGDAQTPAVIQSGGCDDEDR
jgi:hypothetical protein